jgi:N-dimethylarginine dimethylaminohydrolase
MSRYGVRSAYGDLHRVLMHRPGIELARVTDRSLAEFHFRRPVERERFVQEYELMLGRFRQQGVEVLLLSELLADDPEALATIAQRPNMTYTRDLAVVFAGGAVLMSPALKGRWGDQWIIERALERLGVPVLGSIEPPGYLEGGGVTMIGEDTAVASLCDRANQVGTARLRELVLGRQVRAFLEVPLPFGHIHIDGIFMVLDERLALIYPDAFEVFPCRLYQPGAKRPRQVMFHEFLAARGFDLIPITKAERDAGQLNIVVIRRGRTAVGFEGADRVAKELAARGWELLTFPADELFAGNGGAHCMSCPILVA